MSNYIDHAKREFAALYAGDEEKEYDGLLEESVIQLLDVLSTQGHSGGSIGPTLHLFTQLAQFKPLTPLSGSDTEFVAVAKEVGMGDIYQNARNGAVFRIGENGKAYFLDAIVWQTQTGSRWSSKACLADGSELTSRQYIKSFPFTAKTFVIDVIEEEIAKDDWKFTIKDESQLDEVFAYYDKFDANQKA